VSGASVRFSTIDDLRVDLSSFTLAFRIEEAFVRVAP